MEMLYSSKHWCFLSFFICSGTLLYRGSLYFFFRLTTSLLQCMAELPPSIFLLSSLVPFLTGCHFPASCGLVCVLSLDFLPGPLSAWFDNLHQDMPKKIYWTSSVWCVLRFLCLFTLFLFSSPRCSNSAIQRIVEHYSRAPACLIGKNWFCFRLWVPICLLNQFYLLRSTAISILTDTDFSQRSCNHWRHGHTSLSTSWLPQARVLIATCIGYNVFWTFG